LKQSQPSTKYLNIGLFIAAQTFLAIQVDIASWQSTFPQSTFSKNITSIGIPPYSPNIAQCDIFMFPKQKISLKGNHSESLEDILSNVTIVWTTL
jgi:hypothetical protein